MHVGKEYLDIKMALLKWGIFKMFSNAALTLFYTEFI